MLLSRSERVLTCVTPALVTAHKFRDAGSEAAMGTVLTSLQRPGVGSRQPQSRSQASGRPARWVPLWGGCAALLEWGGGLCLRVRNTGSEATLKKGLPFRPKFLKEGTISLDGTILHHEEPSQFKSSPLNVSSVPPSLGHSKPTPRF